MLSKIQKYPDFFGIGIFLGGYVIMFFVVFFLECGFCVLLIINILGVVGYIN